MVFSTIPSWGLGCLLLDMRTACRDVPSRWQTSPLSAQQKQRFIQSFDSWQVKQDQRPSWKIRLLRSDTSHHLLCPVFFMGGISILHRSKLQYSVNWYADVWQEGSFYQLPVIGLSFWRVSLLGRSSAFEILQIPQRLGCGSSKVSRVTQQYLLRSFQMFKTKTNCSLLNANVAQKPQGRGLDLKDTGDLKCFISGGHGN